MTRQQLERHQVWVHLGAIVAGLATGALAPALAGAVEILLWPVLGLLLYATFTQVPLTHLSDAFRDVRFIGAVLTGNFVFVPLLVAVLLPLVPADPAVRLGVLLVLLVPCTDWFITFTHLGGGDTRRALAVTPINLLLQFALLPVLLWIFLGRTFAEILAVDRFARVFITLIVVPLVAAYLTERTVERRASRDAIVAGLGWLPVPLLGTVVFLIAASQVHVVVDSLPVLGRVAAVFVIYPLPQRRSAWPWPGRSACRPGLHARWSSALARGTRSSSCRSPSRCPDPGTSPSSSWCCSRSSSWGGWRPTSGQRPDGCCEPNVDDMEGRENQPGRAGYALTPLHNTPAFGANRLPRRRTESRAAAQPRRTR